MAEKINLDDLLGGTIQTPKSDMNDEAEINAYLNSPQAEEDIINVIKSSTEARTTLGQEEIIELLTECSDEEFEPYRANLEDGMFPTISIGSMSRSARIEGWGLNETKAETILIYRHDKKRGKISTKRTADYYEPDKMVKQAIEAISLDGDKEAYINSVIDKYADTSVLAEIMKMYAKILDYDPILCQPILNGDAKFYTRMSDVDLYNLAIERSKITSTDRMKDELIGLGNKVDYMTSAIIRLTEEIRSLALTIVSKKNETN